MVLVHHDQTEEAVDGEHDDLESACRKAFEIANVVGRLGWRNGASCPDWVTVYRGRALELSVQVTPQSIAQRRPLH